MNHPIAFSRACLGSRRSILSAAAALCGGWVSYSALGQSAAVIQQNDGKLAEYSQSSADIFTQTLLSGYSGNHTIYFGATWGGSGPLGIPQVVPVPPTDFYSSSNYVSAQWGGGSNLLGEAHASRLELMAMEASLQSMQSSLAVLAAESNSDASQTGTFTSITVSGTTPWGTDWEGQTEPWTAYDSRNLAGCYQTELWIFGLLLMLPIILKVRPE
jgi:hypothetical protein